MSDSGLPSQFVDVPQNEENSDALLDLELFGDDNSGADIDGEQGLNLLDESTNQQDVAPSGSPGVHEQQQEDPSNPDLELSFNFDEWLESQEFVSAPENGIANNETLGEVPSQAGLMGGDDQAHPHLAELGAADPSSTGRPTEGLTNLEQVPEFNFDAFNVEEWQNYANTGANVDIDDILRAGEEQQTQDQKQGQHTDHQVFADDRAGATDHTAYPQGNFGSASGHVRPPMASRQQSPVPTPAADSGYGTRRQTPATPNQANNAVVRPGPSNAQGASRAINTAARHPLAEDHADIGDDLFNEFDDESESSCHIDEVEYPTYRADDPLIVEDPPQEEWGRTGQRNGQQVWFNPETKEWQPSASHHDMRATLIARAQAEYPDDRYLHPDPTDGLLHGETAFFKPHQNRGPDRNQCADELFVWREYQSKKDENGKPLRKKPEVIEHPGFMFEGDKILLDPRNNPVVNHKFIPLTLAVHTDGGKLQEMALKPGCRQIDLWARMPRWERKEDKSGRATITPLRGKNTRINMPMLRFREKKGTIAGSDREGTEVIMDGLRRFYNHHGFDPVAAGNSVKSFWRDLEPWEVKQVRLGNTSQFGGRAGKRAVDNETRQAKMEKTLKSIENGKNRQAAKNGDGAGKRNRDDDDADSQGSSVGPPKRRRIGQEADSGLAAFHQGYIGQQRASAFGHGQDNLGFQPSFGQPQGGYAQATGPFRVQYSAYGPQTFPTPAPRRTQQHQYGGVDMQATRSPHVNAQAPTPLNDSLLNSHYYPEDQYPRFNTGVQSFGSRGPQQIPHGSNQVLRDVSNTRPRAEFRSQRYLQDADVFPRPAGNTLAPGGHRVNQVPQQVLGKRRQQDVNGLESAGDRRTGSATGAGWGVPAAPNNNFGPRDSALAIGSGQENLDVQADSDLQRNPENKRRRHNPPPGTEHRQQCHRHPERTPRPSHYGAGGAPTPLMPSDQFFGNAQLHADPPGNHGIGTPQTRQSERFQNVPRRHEPQQVLGKHRREDPMGRWGETMYAPYQNLGEQGPGGDFGIIGEDIHMPDPKRRRMPGQGGYLAPPTQAPPAPTVKKARRRERDAQVPPLQLNTDERIANSQHTPQGLGAVQIPPQNIHPNNIPAGVGGPTQGFDSLGPNPSQLSMLPQTYLQAPTDIRDRRPSNGDESQSLDSALRYTREAFREWTGLEAPVTNLEHSYNVQYREIRSAFRTWWRSEENPHRGDPLPELWRALRWSGGMDDWDAPEDGEHLREARKSGKKAA